MGREAIRRGSRRSFAGLVITVALHGVIFLTVARAHNQQEPPLIMPHDFVRAELVKLGKPRDPFWLPRITQPPRPTAPPKVIKLSDDPNAAKAPVEAPRPDNPQISKDLRRALDRARKLEQLIPTEPEEGQLTGSAAGTASEASAGDAYATAIFDAVRKNFTPPEGLITDAQLARLSTTIKIRVGEDGSILENKLLKSSGNSFFDDACVSAILATHKVPPPPPAARRLAARGYALEFAGKDLK
jgi:TonB family protein